MYLTRLYVSGYRSIRNIDLSLGAVNVITGPNASGKSNLYRSLNLVMAAACGNLAQMLAREGGMPSALWAGARTKNERSDMTIGVEMEAFEFEMTLGLPAPEPASKSEPSFFQLDPQVKREAICYVDGPRHTPLLERTGAMAWARDADGNRQTYPLTPGGSESVLMVLQEPERFPHVSAVRTAILDWRFYHGFRTDADSPIRTPQVGVRTPVLAGDGSDLAAALRTIYEIGDGPTMARCIDHAFPGARLLIEAPMARFSLAMEMPGFRRPFMAAELSDGTLRYLCLVAALLSPRPPALLALNEPETSLHPGLIEPLADLIAEASARSHIWITTHSDELARLVCDRSGAQSIRLENRKGQTVPA